MIVMTMAVPEVWVTIESKRLSHGRMLGCVVEEHIPVVWATIKSKRLRHGKLLGGVVEGLDMEEC